jgi:hypothetical protein
VATPGNATESTSHQATTWVSLPSSASRDSRLSTFRGVGPNQAVTPGPARVDIDNQAQLGPFGIAADLLGS